LDPESLCYDTIYKLHAIVATNIPDCGQINSAKTQAFLQPAEMQQMKKAVPGKNENMI